MPTSQQYLQLNASFSSLHLLVIKEIRAERNIPQGALAASAGKTPSAWSKIENGSSPLTVDALFGACQALGVPPSSLVILAERLVPLFSAWGWYFSTHTLGEGEDQLLPLLAQFYSSPGQERLRQEPYQRISVQSLVSPFFGQQIPTIVEYCRNPDYRLWFNTTYAERKDLVAHSST